MRREDRFLNPKIGFKLEKYHTERSDRASQKPPFFQGLSKMSFYVIQLF
jgi:hypothetical protein